MIISDYLCLDMRRFGRKFSVHVMLKECFQFRPPLVPPLRSRSHPPPIQHHQRIRKRGLYRQIGNLRKGRARLLRRAPISQKGQGDQYYPKNGS